MPADIEIRLLEDVEHLQGCETLQQIVWSIDDREVVPVSQLRAAEHAGGLVAGAFCDGVLAGFVYGFPARPETASDGWGLHSHMLGVAPRYRGLGIGSALKWFQRAWCLERGFAWMAWTFDPLQARNASLNLEHLGAIGVKYYRDFYGRLGGDLAGDVATDRLLALWRLEAPRVLERQRGGPPPLAEDQESGVALAAYGGDPLEPRLDLATPQVTIAAPEATPALFTEDLARTRRWRQAQRAAFGAYLSRGYVVTRFAGGCYHLERGT